MVDDFSPEIVVHVLTMGVCAAFFVFHAVKFFRDRQDIDQRDDAAQSETKARQKEHNQNGCNRCCANFNSTNKKYVCETCNLNVCKTCVQWNSETQIWICRLCSSRDSSPSPEWLQKKLLDRCRVFESAKKLKNLQKVSEEYDRDNENDSGYHPSMSVTSEGSGFGEPAVDPAVLEVHEHVEAIVEQFLGESIDNTTLDPLCRHPEYDRMIEIYHARLRDALQQLIQSLQMAVNNHPLTENQTPTSSHSNLKYIVNEIVEEAIELPYLEESFGSGTPQSPFGPHRSDVDDDDLDEKSYEEILATAILNKVIEQRQAEKRRMVRGSHEDLRPVNGRFSKANNNRMLSNKEIQTNLDTDAESEISKRSVNRIIHSSPTMEFSEDESSFGTESAGEDFSWAKGAAGLSPMFDYVVEEQIEEITTTVEENLSDYETDPLRTNKKVTSRPRLIDVINRPLVAGFQAARSDSNMKYDGANLEFAKSHKVPFPEFGVDVISGGDPDGNLEQDFTTFLSVIGSWEDNWLFRRKKSISPFINMGELVIGDEPVAMLVPNPETVIKATIGDRNVDELSDISEQNSEDCVESSPSDIDEEEQQEEEEEEEGEQDEEEVAALMSDKTSDGDESEVKNLKPDMVTWALNSMVGEIRKKIDTGNPNDFSSSLRSDVGIELDACSGATSCQPNALVHHFTVSQGLKIPVPAPRKSKSSVCSDDLQRTDSKEISVPRFVPAILRCLKETGVKFLTQPQSISIPAGRLAAVKCRASSTHPYRVVWFFGCEPLVKNEYTHFYSLGGDTHCLEIYNTEEIHTGTYSCLAYSDEGETWADFKITVLGACSKLIRPDIKRHLNSYSVEEGETIVLRCKANGTPEPRILWFKDAKQILLDQRCTLERKGQGEWILSITRITTSDSGDYKIVAKNKAGEASSISQIVVVPFGSSQVMALTERANRAHEAVYQEAEDMVDSANKQTMATAIRETNGQTLDVIIRAANEAKQRRNIDSNNQSQTAELESSKFVPDVIPGSIAARERLKWKNAVDMPNNPYTLENVTKRVQRKSRILTDAQLQSDGSLESEDNHLVEVQDGPGKLDCGLKRIDPIKYKRDYYVNHNSETGKYLRRPDSLPLGKKNESSLNAAEEKVYVSTAVVLSLEDKIQNIESQVSNISDETPTAKVNELEDKVAHAVAQVAQSEKQVTNVEKEVARLQRELRYRQSKQDVQQYLTSDSKLSSRLEVPGSILDSRSTCDAFNGSESEGNDNPLDTPVSVKALASKFDVPVMKEGRFQNGSFEHKEDGTTVVRIDTKKPHPAPRRKTTELSSLPQSTLGQNGKQNGSIMTTTTSSNSKYYSDIKPEVLTEVQHDVSSPEICSEETLERSPSVKQLSQMFVEESDGDVRSPTSPIDVSVRRVHSLTARSTSKEFREATQRNMPRQLNRNISLYSDQDGTVVNGHCFDPIVNSEKSSLTENVCDDSDVSHIGSITFAADDGPDLSSDNFISEWNSGDGLQKRPVKKLSQSIKSRAAFWDLRVQEDRMTDQSLADHFPPMDTPLYKPT